MAKPRLPSFAMDNNETQQYLTEVVTELHLLRDEVDRLTIEINNLKDSQLSSVSFNK